MQSYPNIASSRTLKLSRQDLLDRDDALRSNFSGTAFPTDPTPVIGQYCRRTDLTATYQLVSTGPDVWSEVAVGLPLPVAKGGTGGNDAATARTNLGLGALATLSTVGAAQITDDSIGGSEINGSDAAAIRTKLGLGGLATLSAVGAAQITDGSVGTDELGPSVVTSAKMADQTKLVFTEGSPPSTPAANTVALYAKSDGKLYTKDDGGIETSVGGFTQQRFILRDEKTAATAGGSSAALDWTQKRTLNTTSINEISGASVASSVITLPAGTYRVTARAPAFGVGRHKLRLRNTSDTTTTVVGSDQFAGSGVQTDATLLGVFTIAATKNFELQHNTETLVSTEGLGRYNNVSEVSVYSEIEIVKLA